MGLRAHLELHPRRSLLNAMGLFGDKVLFEKKGTLPFAWFLFFAPEDFNPRNKGSSTLSVEASSGVERARERLALLRLNASAPLMRVLERFVELVASAGPGRLVLNTADLDSSKAELTLPLTWLADQRGTRLSKRALEQAERLFGEGIAWGAVDEPNADLSTIDLDDAGEVVGFPLSARHQDVLTAGEDREVISPRRAAPDESAQAIAAVLANPDDLAARLVCADLLTALGDPRGEFILLQCQGHRLTMKQEKRLDKLQRSLGPELEAPFSPAQITFENGFAARARFDSPPESIPKPDDLWKTVHTLELRGAPSMLSAPVFRAVKRVHLDASDVPSLADAGRPVPFRSICFGRDHTAETWQALHSVTLFPELVEVGVEDSISVWLPEGAKELIHRRPGMRVRSDELDPAELRLLTAAEDAERRAKWDAPGRGSQLPGARFDNG